MLLTILDRLLCTGVQFGEQFKLLNFCFKKVLGYMLLICMVIRLVPFACVSQNILYWDRFDQ